MVALLLIVSAGLVLLASRKLDVRRHSPRHLTASLAVGGRGVFFSRTPDGTWWTLRLRPRRCKPWGPGPDPPSANGCREPRRPTPPGPHVSQVALDAPPH